MTTIGRVEFDVDFDGRDLPRQAKQIGRSTGAQLGNSMRSGFDKEMAKLSTDLDNRMKAAGKSAGITVTGAIKNILRNRRRELANDLASIFTDRKVFNDLVISAGSVDEGLQKIGDSLKEARDQGLLTGQQFSRLTLQARNWGNSIRQNEDAIREEIASIKLQAEEAEKLEANMKRLAAQKLRVAETGRQNVTIFGQFRDRMKEVNAESKSFFDIWKEQPRGLRRFSFFTGLFASLGSEISILGSAAGSGLTVLAGSLLSAGIAAGVGIAAFQGLLGPLEELGPNAQVAQIGLKAIGETFSALQDQLQEAVFAGLGEEFTALNDLVVALSPALLLVADAVNVFFSNLAAALTSTQGFETLNALIAGSAPIIISLGDAIIALFSGLGGVFVAALPFVLNFTNKLGELFTQFANFTNSVEGQNALAEWFRNGEIVFGALLPLLATAGQVLNDLVTPTTIALFVQLIENLNIFLGVGAAGILQFLAVADPIGLIAQLLADLSLALAPFADDFLLLAGVINDVFGTAISQLAPIIGQIIGSLAPLLTVVVSVAGALITALLPAIQPLVSAFIALVQIITPVVAIIGAALLPIISALTPIIGVIAEGFLLLVTTALPPLLSLFSSLVPVVLLIIEAFRPVIEAIFPILTQLLGGLLEAVVPLIQAFFELISPILELIAPLLELIGPILGPLIELLVLLVTAGAKPVTEAFKSVLIPIVKVAAEVFKDLFPILEFFIDLLGNVIDFVVNVFKGNWSGAWDAVKNIFVDAFSGLESIAKGFLNGVISIINGVIGGLNSVSKLNPFGGGFTLPLIPKLASGALVTGPLRALIGEAGPEAVVPLRRPLSQVDPSVRALSAIAQGKSLPASADGASRSITVEDGAIRVIGVADPRQSATAVLDRLVAIVG